MNRVAARKARHISQTSAGRKSRSLIHFKTRSRNQIPFDHAIYERKSESDFGNGRRTPHQPRSEFSHIEGLLFQFIGNAGGAAFALELTDREIERVPLPPITSDQKLIPVIAYFHTQ